MDGPKPLRQRRLECGLSQQQLAELVGCDHSLVSKLERGERRARPALRERLDAILAERGLP